MRQKYISTCLCCQKSIVHKPLTERDFCSEECRKEYNHICETKKLERGKHIYKYEIICASCNKKVTYITQRQKSKTNLPLYCSEECREISKKNKMKTKTLNSLRDCSKEINNYLLQEIMTLGEKGLIETIEAGKDVLFRNRITRYI